jgi:hypothetical protein
VQRVNAGKAGPDDNGIEVRSNLGGALSPGNLPGFDQHGCTHVGLLRIESVLFGLTS